MILIEILVDFFMFMGRKFSELSREVEENTSRKTSEISGDDALTGNTGTHPEHHR